MTLSARVCFLLATLARIDMAASVRDGAVALVGVALSKSQNMYVPSRFTVAAE
jgi:hypothetical protein